METLFKDSELPAHLQRMVDAGVSGLDIMHGELNNLMLMKLILFFYYQKSTEILSFQRYKILVKFV